MDFVPLTCAVIGLCVALFSFLSVSLEAPSMQVVDALDNVMDEAKFKPEPAKTKPSLAAVPQVEQPAQGSAPAGTGGSSSPMPQPSGTPPAGGGTTPTPGASSGSSGSGGGTTVVGVGVVSGSGGGGTDGGSTGIGSDDGSVFGAGDGLTPDTDEADGTGAPDARADGANPVSQAPATLGVSERS